ncbi:translation initiation factor IF-2 [Spiroplasma endosymbiont of Amphibalanus improvisus]|uniref:translation initiation factor IF-2 n=1 Tax=Spiroplasma endosymbiont of Amphibalanus improvisus TaxID=3066327 RepID=UPI003CC7AD34
MTKNNDFKEKIKLQKDNINKQLKSIDTGVKDGVFVYSSEMTIIEFADKINKNVSEPIKYFFNKGKMLNQNALLTEEQIGELCLEFDLDFKKEVEVTHENLLENWQVEEDKRKLKKRPPIVTIMGHVDHGKTTLLDKIRQSNITDSEHGGITQHIGAYSINRDKNNSITFIDTPGHAVFTHMRARGSMITDVVILVVAADDGVKPQTKEALDHAKDADVPIIIFINKMDKNSAKPDNVMSKLSEFELTPEEWGGSTPYVKGSAVTGDGIDELLDTILLVSELQELKTDPNRFASGTVLESKLDKSLGPVATLLIQSGTLKEKDVLVCGSSFGYVRNIRNSANKIVKQAGPSTPVTVTGLNNVPYAGSKFLVFGDEKLAREVAEKRKNNLIMTERRKQNALTLEELNQQFKDGQLKQIKIILKTDVHGTIEAIKNGLSKLDIPGVKLLIIRGSVGTITTTDIDLAISSKALIIGFNIRPDNNVRKKAQEDGVEVLLYNVIYKLIDEIKDVAQGLLDPVEEEVILGEAEVRKLFSHSSVGVIAGCKVQSGVMRKKAKVRIIRDSKVIYIGEINNLKQGKNDVNELKKDQECGITIKKFNDIKEGDIIEAYEIKIKKTLLNS